MGGRGASSGGNSEKSFIRELVSNYDDFTRGDLQAVVEARAMSNVGNARDIKAVAKEADRMLKIIDSEKDKLESAKEEFEKADREYKKYAKSANYTNKFRDEMDEWSRKRDKAQEKYSKLANKYSVKRSDVPF